MDRMLQCDVLVCGMLGLGAEVAKDIVLAGVRSIMVQDVGDVNLSDLSSQVCVYTSIEISLANLMHGRKFCLIQSNEIFFNHYKNIFLLNMCPFPKSGLKNNTKMPFLAEQSANISFDILMEIF